MRSSNRIREAGTPTAQAREGSPGEDLRRLASGGMLNLVGSVVGAVLGFVLVVVFTRGLGPGGSGALFEAIALFLILAELATLGADTGLLRGVPRVLALERRAELAPTISAALWPVLGIGSAIALGVIVSAEHVGDLLIHGPEHAAGVTYLRILAPFIPLAAATTVALSGTRGFGSMLPYVALDRIGVPLVRPMLAGMAIAAGLGPAAMALAWVLPVAVEFPLALAILGRLVRTTKRTGPARPTRELAAEFWRFAAPRGAAGMFQILVLWLDVILVGAFLAASAAGVYAATSRLAMIGMFAAQAVQMAIAPQISALFSRNDRAGAQRLYTIGTGWLMAPSWPLYILLAVFAPVVLRLFGPEFVRGQTVLVILSLAMLFNLGTGNVNVILLMAGKSWWNLCNTLVSLVINVGLNLLLIPRYGITGAALAWATSILWQNLAPVFQLRRAYRIQPFGPGWAIVAGASLACYGGLGILLRAALGPTVPALVVTAVLGTVLYGAILWTVRRPLQLTTFLGSVRFRGGKEPVAPSSPQGRPLQQVDSPMKSAVKRALRSYGAATSSLRALPDFLIIGAKRGGTTSLSRYLFEHPAVAPLFPSAMRIKGVHYFDVNFRRGERWYRSHFHTVAGRTAMARVSGFPVVTGEASPYYLFHPLAAQRAAGVAPDAKIVAILRNPVDRAYSHWRERARNGGEALTFDDALRAEDARLAGEEDRILEDDGYVSYAHEHFSYCRQGLYLEPLTRWVEQFGSDRVLVLLNEDLDADPSGTYERLLHFLGLPSHEPPAFPRYNYEPSAPMNPETRKWLERFYRPYNDQLGAYLGLDLSLWGR
jgi:O-antigen/teichoic acid export membrane protein